MAHRTLKGGHFIQEDDPAGFVNCMLKVAAMRCGIVIAVSAPTADAVALAERAGITLVALARPDRFEAFTHTDRIVTEPAHVGHPR